MTVYYRPIVQTDTLRPDNVVTLAGGPLWFDRVEQGARGAAGQIVPIAEVPDDVLARLVNPRQDICGVSMTGPSIMGILNVTPDSFSDGGSHDGVQQAVAAAQKMRDDGADMIDIGGESTRPGAVLVDAGLEVLRTMPVIEALEGAISIDTRKADVARVAIAAGAGLFNDVTALTFDSDSLAVAAETGVAVCLMHARGAPETMQDNPVYADVLYDVYDYLEGRIQACEAAGISREKIMVDPGIGFGKTIKHNLALLRGISLFHGLGCPILLGASRKGFIGKIGNTPDPKRRFAGSMAVAQQGLNQGVQMLRVHDIAETKQAIALWRAMIG
ncbi:MAG: dihydropteroate synthase [Rhodobacteraceae bacterium]|nr:dihydropteroate synthase [Paracoccaceae bacterium]